MILPNINPEGRSLAAIFFPDNSAKTLEDAVNQVTVPFEHAMADFLIEQNIADQLDQMKTEKDIHGLKFEAMKKEILEGIAMETDKLEMNEVQKAFIFVEAVSYMFDGAQSYVEECVLQRVERIRAENKPKPSRIITNI